jgi:hypothetical protein
MDYMLKGKKEELRVARAEAERYRQMQNNMGQGGWRPFVPDFHPPPSVDTTALEKDIDNLVRLKVRLLPPVWVPLKMKSG